MIIVYFPMHWRKRLLSDKKEAQLPYKV